MANQIPTGTPLTLSPTTPTLFTPLKIRSLTLQNRFVVSAMGTWSAQDGRLTDFHIAHYGQFAFRGAALIFGEATAVTSTARYAPQDAGLWEDAQIEPLKRVIDFVHLHGQKFGVQLCHAGRKAGMGSRFLPQGVPLVDDGGVVDVWGPSPIAYSEAARTPREMSVEVIEETISAFGDAAARAVKAGADLVEIHAAHGVLIHQFLSPLTNKRTDDYGGSFENRTRLLHRVLEDVRAKIGEEIALGVRVSGTDWMEWSGQPSWDVEESIRLAKVLPDWGVDLYDISSGALVEEQMIEVHPTYQIDLARKIRQAVRADGSSLLIAAVGWIDSPEVAKSVVQVKSDKDDDQAGDLVCIARQFLREPGLVLRSAQELGVDVQWPFQYQLARPRQAGK